MTAAEMEIERLDQETNKLRAEARKLDAEAWKLDAEERKMRRDRDLAPWQIVISALIAGAGLLAAGAGLLALLLKWTGAMP
jgi:FtsZ-binding cell division protein ZapB